VRIEQVSARLSELVANGLPIRIAPGAEPADLDRTEKRLGLTLPAQVVTFWKAFDGIRVDDPPFLLLPHSDFVVEDGLILFGRCDNSVPLAFDTRSPNEAGQWSIVNADSGYRITFTMASFWSAHMWTWIVKRRPIWIDGNNGGTTLALPRR
jgi:hypothetical protein